MISWIERIKCQGSWGHVNGVKCGILNDIYEFMCPVKITYRSITDETNGMVFRRLKAAERGDDQIHGVAAMLGAIDNRTPNSKKCEFAEGNRFTTPNH